MHKLNSRFSKALTEGKTKNNWDKIIGVVQELTGKTISENVSTQLIKKIMKEILDKKLVLEPKSKAKSTLASSLVETSVVETSAPELSKSEMQPEKQDETITNANIDKKRATFLHNYNKFKTLIEDTTFPKKLQQAQLQPAYESLLKLREQFIPELNVEPELKAALDKIEESIVKLQTVLKK